jgi:hypothetical protein
MQAADVALFVDYRRAAGPYSNKDGEVLAALIQVVVDWRAGLDTLANLLSDFAASLTE